MFNLIVQALCCCRASPTRSAGSRVSRPRRRARIFAVAECDRFGFDVEALYLAQDVQAMRIDELPVRCRYHGGSSVNRIGDGSSA